jgi:D-alanine-D-alanine ligase
MNEKIRVGILFGGRSAEHEVSLLSAKNVIEALDKDKYEVELIGIDKKGGWHLQDAEKFLLDADNPKKIQLGTAKECVTLVPKESGKQLVSLSGKTSPKSLDVIFPVLHGPLGEDGTIQGLLKLADIAFVGAGVLGSAVGMDKDVMKRLLRDAKIPTAQFIALQCHEEDSLSFEEIVAQVGFPFFVKPANLGSSVGISKVKEKNMWKKALKNAFQYDNKILIEEFIAGREFECSVLGNEFPIASLPGEVIAQHEFYSYEAKYIDAQGALFKIPADLEEALVQDIRHMAVKAYRALCCEGMARVDFFLSGDGRLLINEINTIPGFTNISMYPKMWEASGLSYSKLLDRLIELALERFEKEKRLLTYL